MPSSSGTRVVVLLGPPGAGKGTQAVRLAAECGLPHVSTGDLFRENVGGGTELGERARGFMDKGELVPDELVLDMLFDRVARPDCGQGYLLDGFPRTLVQAEALGAKLDASSSSSGAPSVVAPILQVDDEVLVQRASGRLLCRGCSNIHHRTFSPPKAEGVCDACGGELYRREDDAPEVVRERLRVYAAQTAPVADWYESRGQLVRVDGSRTPDEVFADLVRVVRGDEREGA